jgi:hypothetical protein
LHVEIGQPTEAFTNSIETERDRKKGLKFYSDPERREARLASNCVGKEKDLRIIPGNRGKV